ncbi:MAG: sigma 54-interacting transcriptional regulator, partial [Myxococcales bacterium]|nr:sigma 54-interacting transcriptional regulator [Myxococcales bacterium]
MSITRDDRVTCPPDTLLVAGKGQLRTFLLDKPEIVIGRDHECDVAIDDPSLSRRHFVLRLGPPMTVQDLGSKNGIHVRGTHCKGGDPIELAPGESVQVGGLSCLVMASASVVPSSNRAHHELLLVPDPTPAAASQTITDVATSGINVLILGESGVGKDVLAETLHELSRRTGPLQRINCAALSEQLLESELFGHEKGAFTGATHARPGLLEAAHGGTVFLDEIGEISLATQARLLRAIETREIIRLGATRSIEIDVRFICATNRELAREVADRRFRHDLYFRIDGITLRVPPLRDRRGMIARLATTFAERAGATSVTTEAIAQLEAHDWPGNVRELKAVIERAAILA